MIYRMFVERNYIFESTTQKARHTHLKWKQKFEHVIFINKDKSFYKMPLFVGREKGMAVGVE